MLTYLNIPLLQQRKLQLKANMMLSLCMELYSYIPDGRYTLSSSPHSNLFLFFLYPLLEQMPTTTPFFHICLVSGIVSHPTYSEAPSNLAFKRLICIGISSCTTLAQLSHGHCCMQKSIKKKSMHWPAITHVTRVDAFSPRTLPKGPQIWATLSLHFAVNNHECQASIFTSRVSIFVSLRILKPCELSVFRSRENHLSL